nr:19 kDa protein [wheat closterovirus 1]
MSDTQLAHFKCESPYMSYVYLKGVGPSLFVLDKREDPSPLLIFDDGFVTVDEDAVKFFDRNDRGILSWFNGREPYRVDRIDSCRVNVKGNNYAVKFINSDKTMVFIVNFGKDFNFVGDADVFICGGVEGSIFFCLKSLFFEQPRSSRLLHYYEDNSAAYRLH